MDKGARPPAEAGRRAPSQNATSGYSALLSPPVLVVFLAVGDLLGVGLGRGGRATVGRPLLRRRRGRRRDLGGLVAGRLGGLDGGGGGRRARRGRGAGRWPEPPEPPERPERPELPGSGERPEPAPARWPAWRA